MTENKKLGVWTIRRGPRMLLAVFSVAAVICYEALSRGELPRVQDRRALDEILSKAQTAVEQGHLDVALKECQEVLAQDPDSVHALFLLGVIELERGNDEEAKKALVRSVALDSSRIASHIALGKTYLSLREWRPAAKQFQVANELGDSTGSGHFGLGVALLRQSQYSEALLHLRRAVEVDARDPEWIFTLIGAELQLKQVSNVRKHIILYEKLTYGDASAFFRLGKLLAEHGMSKDAEAWFGRAAALLEKAPRRPQSGLKLSDVDLQVARLRYDQRDDAGALESLNRIEPSLLEPKTRAEMLHLEGTALSREGKLTEGREKLRQAAEDVASASDYFFDWAWAELLAGNIQTATTAVNTAISRWPEVPDIQMLKAIVQRESTPERARLPFLAEWHLKGEGVVCCPCAVPCPCRSNGRPTHGHCESAGAYRITEGHYHNVRLEGFTFISMHACMGPESTPSVIYVEPSTADEKVIAMERIFQALDPLRPFLFLSVKRTRVSWVRHEDSETYEASVPQVVELKVQRLLDSRGEPLLRTAALDRFSNTIEYARNLTYKTWDDNGRLRWDYSGRQANFRKIDLDARDYMERTMLFQFADGSGFFNAQQSELIRRLKLPTLRSYPRPAK